MHCHGMHYDWVGHCVHNELHGVVTNGAAIVIGCVCWMVVVILLLAFVAGDCWWEWWLHHGHHGQWVLPVLWWLYHGRHECW